MEEALLNIFKLGLLISLPYASGIAARIWWEVKFFLILISAPTLLFLFLNSVISAEGMTVPQDLKDIISYSIIFTALGYLTGPPIIKYFGLQLEKHLSSDELDSTYRKYAKHHREAFDSADIDSLHEHFRAQYAQTRSRSKTSYEEYSQHRRAQSQAERTTPPPQQSEQSEKDKMLDILEVSDRNANAKTLKSVYRKLAWKYHPDVLARNKLSDVQIKKAETRMQEINRAYDWLEENGFAE